MPDIRSSLAIKKSIKDKLQNLDFVKKHSDEQIIELLMDFYEDNKDKFERWLKKKIGKK